MPRGANAGSIEATRQHPSPVTTLTSLPRRAGTKHEQTPTVEGGVDSGSGRGGGEAAGAGAAEAGGGDTVAAMATGALAAAAGGGGDGRAKMPWVAAMVPPSNMKASDSPRIVPGMLLLLPRAAPCEAARTMAVASSEC